jgi:hypothetical protein
MIKSTTSKVSFSIYNRITNQATQVQEMCECEPSRSPNAMPFANHHMYLSPHAGPGLGRKAWLHESLLGTTSAQQMPWNYTIMSVCLYTVIAMDTHDAPHLPERNTISSVALGALTSLQIAKLFSLHDLLEDPIFL